ncbi:MAG: hypothetical protein P8Y45_17295 [Exilibacterium sp.]
MIDADDSSIKRERFWTNRILAVTESDSITLENTPVPDGNVFSVGHPKQSKPFAL